MYVSVKSVFSFFVKRGQAVSSEFQTLGAATLNVRLAVSVGVLGTVFGKNLPGKNLPGKKSPRKISPRKMSPRGKNLLAGGKNLPKGRKKSPCLTAYMPTFHKQ